MGLAARLPTSALILALGVILASDASGQPGPPPIPDAAVKKMIELGLQNIHRAVCEGINQCAPATPAEFENPPITIDQARDAVLAGGRSALARWCGLDADRRSVLPMTRHLRQVLKFNVRQIALMAVIHGIQQSLVSQQLHAKGACDEATRSKVDAQLPKT